MNKKELIVKDKSIKIKLCTNHLEFIKDNMSLVISYKFISNIYITNQLNISLKDITKLAINIPVFIIDFNGHILAKVDVNV